MSSIVECVPNFSEGRDTETIERLVEVVESVAGAWVLHTHADADHHRSVITYAGDPQAVVEAAVRAAALAAELIDLREHTGAHPRVGALDVLPFVPVRGVTLADCAALAHEAGERIWREVGVPVYFYEAAARRPERVNLEDVRRGGFELLQVEARTNPERAPDVGGPDLHASAGACVVGARPLLVAYNINLRTTDVSVARRVARAVRGRDGGLRYLKALGFALPGRGLTQVSMNLVRFEQTQLHHVFAAVQREAERWGVQIAGSEIVGLVPQAALDRSAEFFLRLENFTPDVVLENRLAAKAGEGRANAEVEAGSLAPVSGGGVAAARAAALGAALGEMIAGLIKRKNNAEDAGREADEALLELASLRARLLEAATEDAASFAHVLAARRLPRANDEEARARGNEIEAALKGATTVPLEVAGVSVQVGELLEALAELGEAAWLADAAAGAQLARAAVAAARYNVLVNTARLEDEEFRAEQRARAADLLERAEGIAERVEALLFESLGRDGLK